MAILSCGPFERKGTPTNSETASIDVPIQTQGDWVNTDEGRAALKEAETAVVKAATDGYLPKGTKFTFEEDSQDRARIEVPFDNWQESVRAGKHMKKLISEITKAAVRDTPAVQKY